MAFTISDVVARGMCVGCGACAVRTDGKVSVTLGRYRTYEASLAEDLTAAELDAASRVCPMSDDGPDEDELAATRFGDLERHPRVGHWLGAFAGRITDDDRVVDSSSGGLTTWFLARLLRGGDVDGVIHVGRAADSGAAFEFVVSRSVEELELRRKSMYTSVSLQSGLDEIRGAGGRYAIVGVPCFIKAARRLALESPELHDQLRYFVGIVCGHLKSQFFGESLAWQAGVAPDQLESVDFRVKNPSRPAGDYDFQATANDGTVHTLRTRKAIDGNWGYGAFQPEACNFCDDIFAESADIVFGDAWLPEYTTDWRGTNVVVVRDAALLAMFDSGVEAGEIATEALGPDRAAESQGGNFRHRRDGLQVRLADDIRRGLPVPKKRLAPSTRHVTRQRLALIRQRRLMSALSLRAFAEAREADDLDVYRRALRPEIATYRSIEHPPSLAKRWDRLRQRARAIVRRVVNGT